MTVINESSEIGQLVVEATEITGSLWLSLLLFLIFLIVVATSLRLPTSIIAMILLPFIYVGILITTNFLSALAFIIVILSLFFVKKFF